MRLAKVIHITTKGLNPMPYIQAVTKAGKTIILEQYQAPRWNVKSENRLPAMKGTAEAQEKANARREERELTIKLNANFHPGDHHLVLDYTKDNRPETIEQAKKDREKFMRRLRYLYQKDGKVLKYIIITEWGKKGGLHHHLIVNRGVDQEKIRKIWNKGRVHFNPLDDTGEYSLLASYLLKRRRFWKERGGTGRQWTGSRNLKRPKTVKRIIRMDVYYERPKPRKGYILVESSEREGFTKDGFPYRSCVFVKVSRGQDP